VAKTVLFWVVIALSAFLLWSVIKANRVVPPAAEISYSAFVAEVEAGNISSITLSKIRAVGVRRDGSRFRANVPSSQEGLLQLLHQKNVEIWVQVSDETTGMGYFLNLLLPIAVLGALWFYMIRRIRSVRVVDVPPEGSRPPNIG
jgi:cell division protease FtsH